MLAECINAFGFLFSCLVDKHYGLIGGEAQVLAAKRLGMTTVPRIRIEHLSEADKRVFVIADAKVSEGARWDLEVLREDLRFLSELRVDFNFSTIGFETAEVDDILARGVAEPDDEHSDTAPTHRPAVSRRGDVLRLGRHLVSCANPTDARSYEPLAQCRARLVIADPPLRLFESDGRIDGYAAGHVGIADGDQRGSDNGHDCGGHDREGHPLADGDMGAVSRTPVRPTVEKLFNNFAAVSIDGALH
jgi:hypothetical protein